MGNHNGFFVCSLIEYILWCQNSLYEISVVIPSAAKQRLRILELKVTRGGKAKNLHILAF